MYTCTFCHSIIEIEKNRICPCVTQRNCLERKHYSFREKHNIKVKMFFSYKLKPCKQKIFRMEGGFNLEFLDFFLSYKKA